MTWDLFWFIVGIGMFLTTVVSGIVAANRVRKRKDALPALGVLGISLVLGGIIMFLDSFTTIPPRNEGIVNTLGRTEGSIGPGWHRVKPWSSIETVDATVQNINLNADLAAKDQLKNLNAAFTCNSTSGSGSPVIIGGR